ncbi:hypothetical protein JI739_19110 [Ramlibacter sp. AW1]|uniref:DUF7210 domain-containing protein n=1 Tax=Ramlibacter aurantiacus TaxID=2801330 RepID=A0A937D583_9BURK|nr:hypothetical protein [Ramlibacter aurantiacus]MBL0422465.1 hypothetical protein [Ramlibacter aurantiacus]
MKTQLLLTGPHTHAGRKHQPGERIEVDGDLARWLLSIGSARALPAARTESQPLRAAQSAQSKEPNP